MGMICRLITGALVCAAVGLVLTACSTQAPTHAVHFAASMAQVKADYWRAHQVLENRIAQLPEPDAVLWRDFVRDADEFKAALETMWTSAVVSPELMAGLYQTGVDLYVRAHRLIAPDLKSLPLNDQITLRQMDSALRRLAEVYKAWTADSQAIQHAEIAASGVELIKLALQIGATVL